MKRKDTTQMVAEYLMSKGAMRYSAWTVAAKVRDACLSNVYFVANHRNPRCTVKNSFVDRYSVTLDLVEPDAERTTACRLTYAVKYPKRGGAKMSVRVKAL